MLIYCNAILMKQESHSVFCRGAFMSHHDSLLFQKAGTTGLRTGSLSCINVLYLSPGAPPEFPPSRLSPASVSGVQFHDSSSVHCIACSPPQVKSPSITTYPLYLLPSPFPSDNQPLSSVSVWLLYSLFILPLHLLTSSHF